MYSQDEIKSLQGFLRATSEGNLKKMLVGGKMTEAHLRILLKVARSTSEDEFVNYFETATFPKIKFSGQESPLKEHFWPICAEACAKVGLLTSNAAKKAA
jgi:hypothetical protein